MRIDVTSPRRNPYLLSSLHFTSFHFSFTHLASAHPISRLLAYPHLTTLHLSSPLHLCTGRTPSQRQVVKGMKLSIVYKDAVQLFGHVFVENIQGEACSTVQRSYLYYLSYSWSNFTALYNMSCSSEYECTVEWMCVSCHIGIEGDALWMSNSIT